MITAASVEIISAFHPDEAVPGDDGRCCKLPVGFRPMSRR